MAMTVEELTALIAALPDVAVVLADEASEAPEVSWGDRFFFVGRERQMPFATIVERDYPGWDEDSRLDRPGVFRLNVSLGRENFEDRFGFGPAAFPARRAEFDFTRLDHLMPHPVYATQGWACILNPGPGRRAEIRALVTAAHTRAASRA